MRCLPAVGFCFLRQAMRCMGSGSPASQNKAWLL
jgi:hypothetical protein